MTYRAIHIEQDPLNHFLSGQGKGETFLQIADVILRENKDPKEVFAHLIRVATKSEWSHSAIIYLLSDPSKGFNNTFLVEAKTKGIYITSWRNEVVPFEEFTVGIKRPRIDWYVETPYEVARHDPHDAEDMPGISYLRHVRGVAMDQISGLYDKKTVYELAALYTERVARHRLGAVPQVADAAADIAKFFKKWDEADASATSALRFICSGLVQYSFFEALRLRIAHDMDIAPHQEAAISNLSNLSRIIFCADPQGIIAEYVQKVQRGQLDIHDPAPEDVLDLLKTATPADFNNSANLDWRIEEAPEGYQAQGKDEQEILNMIMPEHHSLHE